MKNEIQLKRAMQASKEYFNELSKQYSTEVAKKAFYRTWRTQTKKEKLIEEKKELEERLERIKKQI